MPAKETEPHPCNRLLGLLSPSLEERMTADCELVHLGTKDVLYEAHEPMSGVYFPLNAVVSLVAIMEDGAEIEVATTGNEGMLGLPLFLGTNETPLKAFSQVPGESLRLSTPKFRKYLKEEPELASVLHRFTQALMMQISQSSVCNRVHPIDQRCCRWLLMTHDRLNKENFALTQEFLGQMLGVRRASVGQVAGELQEAKLIEYSRGMINVLNRRGLEKRTCRCYFVIRDEYERLLNGKSKK